MQLQLHRFETTFKIDIAWIKPIAGSKILLLLEVNSPFSNLFVIKAVAMDSRLSGAIQWLLTAGCQEHFCF